MSVQTSKKPQQVLQALMLKTPAATWRYVPTRAIPHWSKDLTRCFTMATCCHHMSPYYVTICHHVVCICLLW